MKKYKIDKITNLDPAESGVRPYLSVHMVGDDSTGMVVVPKQFSDVVRVGGRVDAFVDVDESVVHGHRFGNFLLLSNMHNYPRVVNACWDELPGVFDSLSLDSVRFALLLWLTMRKMGFVPSFNMPRDIMTLSRAQWSR